MSLFSAAYPRSFGPALLALLAACASDPKGTTGGSGGGGAIPCTGEACADAGDSGGQGGGQSAGQTAGNASGDGNDGQEGGESSQGMDCAKLEVEAELVKKPVDIIWVVDSSGSMDGEAAIVQENMNAFAASIAASGLDYRVVVISTKSFVNVPDPLGSDATHFLFVEEDVGSDEPLDALIERFGDYSSFLRPNAITHLVAVTDDEARKEGGFFASDREPLTRDWFLAEMSRLLGHEFTLHAVASPSPKCKGAANPGVIYDLLVTATSGLSFSICATDWSPLFTQLSSAVTSSAPIECAFDLPPPPDGQTLDKDKVNVNFTVNGASAATVIGRTSGADKCQAGGWYYDNADAPKRIQICDSTCTEIRKQSEVAIDIQLGCETVLVVE